MAKRKKLLRKDVEKLVDLKTLFPKSQPNFREGLTEYQEKKIKKAIKEIKENNADWSKMITMKGNRRAYMEENDLPIYQKGIPLPGGTKINSDLYYSIHKGLHYKRDGEEQTRFNLDVSSEEALIKSAKQILRKRHGRKATLMFFGRAIGAVRPTEDDDLLIRELVYYYNKYVRHAGETRRTRNQFGKTVYQKLPEQWEMQILFEEDNEDEE